MLSRDIENKMIGGVCAGLAKHFDIDAALVRLAFLLGILFGSATFWIYIVLWIVMPIEGEKNQE